MLKFLKELFTNKRKREFINALKLVESGDVANASLGISLIKNYPKEFKNHFGLYHPEMFALVEELAFEKINTNVNGGMHYPIMRYNLEIARKYEGYFRLIKYLRIKKQTSEEATVLKKIEVLKLCFEIVLNNKTARYGL